MFAQNDFSSTTFPLPNMDSPMHIITRDFNEEGYPDLAISGLKS